MHPTTDVDPLSLPELLQAMHERLEDAVPLAKQALLVAQRSGQSEARQFFQKCLADLERAGVDAQRLRASLAVSGGASPAQSGEQVSSASFAPGDGANDAQVTPEEARGKPGNWPAY